MHARLNNWEVYFAIYGPLKTAHHWDTTVTRLDRTTTSKRELKNKLIFAFCTDIFSFSKKNVFTAFLQWNEQNSCLP